MNTTQEKPAENKRQTIVINCDAKRLMPDLLWVLKARSTDPMRLALSTLFVDSYGITCTDGKRLHHFTNKEVLPALDPGAYDVIVTKTAVTFEPSEHEFPDYRRIMPQYSDKNKSIINLDEKKSLQVIALSAALVKIAIKHQGGKTGLNYDDLSDLCGYTWEVTSAENVPERAVQFKSGACVALLMPIRLEYK